MQLDFIIAVPRSANSDESPGIILSLQKPWHSKRVELPDAGGFSLMLDELSKPPWERVHVAVHGVPQMSEEPTGIQHLIAAPGEIRAGHPLTDFDPAD